jgi:hypothetical protein
MIEVQIKGAAALAKALNAASQEENKALETAIRVSGYRLRKTLQQEIRSGAPGGQRFAPLSLMARKRGKSAKRSPLRRLATAVRYHVTRDPFSMAVGWVGPRVSKSWKRIAEEHQKGFTIPVTDPMREYLAQRGARLGKRSRFRRVFFLRASTREFQVPARPILDPFWERHREAVWRQIRRDYRRKLRGERI